MSAFLTQTIPSANQKIKTGVMQTALESIRTETRQKSFSRKKFVYSETAKIAMLFPERYIGNMIILTKI